MYNLEVSYIGNYFPETADLQQVADQGGEFKHILFQLLPGLGHPASGRSLDRDSAGQRYRAGFGCT